MTKTLSEAKLTTPNARKALSEGVHWRGLNADVHLGYRKGKRAGRWLVRWYVGAQTYRQETIAPADDALAPDGVGCLSFEQARSKALDIVADRKVEEIASASGPAPTVRSAIESYMDARQVRDLQIDSTRKGDARARLTKHVLSTSLADTLLHALTETDLIKWLDGLSVDMAPATVRRLVNDLKAALNVNRRAKLTLDRRPILTPL